MARLTEKDFKKDVSSKNFKNIYFIYGEEKYLVRHYSNSLIEKITGKNPSDFNFQKIKNTDKVDNIIQSAEMLPLGVDIKCVFVVDYDINALSENELKKIIEFISDIPMECIVVFALPTLSFDTKKIPSKWKKFIEAVDKYGIILNCEKRTENALEKQLVSWAEKLGVKMYPNVANKLIKMCGTDLLVLRNELEKLCAYSGYTEINADMVADISTKNFETNIFRLSTAIFGGNSNTAFEIIDILFYQREKAVSIFAVLSLAYIDAYRVRVAYESGKNIAELSKIFKEYKGSNDFRLKNAEKILKSVKVDERVLTENLIAKLLLLAGGKNLD